MNAERVLQLYDRVSEAPDAIPRLRRFILDLAARGKLVEEDPNDEPASELLKRIEREKAGLIKAGEISNGTKNRQAKAVDLPFRIRRGWCPARIEDVLLEIQTGPFGSSLHKRDYQKGGTPVINPASLQNEKIVPLEKMAVGAQTLERLKSFKLRDGDIVMARRGEMGRCAVVTTMEAGWLCGTGSLILRPSRLMYNRFLVLVLGSPFGRAYLSGSAVGSTMQNLNQSILLDLGVGLPPYPEQRRIVAKVDELMALCDSLEAERKKREATRDRLTTASLSRLTAPDVDEKQFKAHADFAIRVLPELTTRPDQIKVLRQTILDLAVRGKLVEQDPNDEPISEYLLKFSNRKKKPTKEEVEVVDGLCRIEESQDAPFDLPDGWSWLKLGSLGTVASSSRVHKKDWSSAGVPFYRAREIVRLSECGKVENELFISEELYRSLLAHGVVPESGDVMITGVGTIGVPYVVTSRDRFYFKDASVLIFKNRYSLESQFLYWLMRSPYWIRQAHVGSMGTTVHTLTIRRSKEILVPLPPIGEQSRIALKVAELMGLCDSLGDNRARGQRTKTRLLEALLLTALEPSINEAA